MNRLCIIPARSGSKGVKNKNMLFLNNKHLIEYTIIAALESGLFKEKNIIVSTDSKHYIEVLSEKYNITFDLRPGSLSGDNVTTFDTLDYILEKYNSGEEFVLLQPTSPFRNSQHIIEAWNLFNKSDYKCIVSMMEAEISKKLYTKLDHTGRIIDNIGVDTNYRRQDSATEYVPNGAIYISEKETYLKSKSFFTKDTGAYLMSPSSSHDIDTPDDFISAVGKIYFDKESKEKADISLFQNQLSSIVDINVNNWLVGDSRLINYLEDETFSNLSISGLTLNNFTLFIHEYSNQLPRKLVLVLGINDIITNYSDTEIIDNFDKIIQLSKEKNIDLEISLILETLYYFYVDNTKVKHLNEMLKKLCEKNCIRHFDPNIELSDDDGLNRSYTDDGLHLNEGGQKIYNGVVSTSLKKL